MQWFMLIFGVFALIAFLLVGMPIMEGGVNASNATANATEYTGYVATLNFSPWLIFILLLLLVAYGWWKGRGVSLRP